MYHFSQSISAISSTCLFCSGDILAQWSSTLKGSYNTILRPQNNILQFKMITPQYDSAVRASDAIDPRCNNPGPSSSPRAITLLAEVQAERHAFVYVWYLFWLTDHAHIESRSPAWPLAGQGFILSLNRLRG
jgi:hypothetical protein